MAEAAAPTAHTQWSPKQASGAGEAGTDRVAVGVAGAPPIDELGLGASDYGTSDPLTCPPPLCIRLRWWVAEIDELSLIATPGPILT
eukprot:gene9087-biopygen7947